MDMKFRLRNAMQWRMDFNGLLVYVIGKTKNIQTLNQKK